MDNITTPTTETRKVPPNVQKLADTINKSSNPQASLELLAAILKYGKTVREPKEAPPAPAKAIEEDVSPVIDEIDVYINRSHLPETSKRYDMVWGQFTALRTLSLKDPSTALLRAFCYGRAKGYRMGLAEAKRKEAQA